MYQRDDQSDEGSAFPEARIVKYSYLEDYYDCRDSIKAYNKSGNPNHLRSLKSALIGLYSQLRVEFESGRKKHRKKYTPFVDFMDQLLQSSNVPKFETLLKCFFIMQTKLKEMKVLDITFPEADIGKDFRRSF